MQYSGVILSTTCYSSHFVPFRAWESSLLSRRTVPRFSQTLLPTHQTLRAPRALTVPPLIHQPLLFLTPHLRRGYGGAFWNALRDRWPQIQPHLAHQQPGTWTRYWPGLKPDSRVGEEAAVLASPLPSLLEDASLSTVMRYRNADVHENNTCALLIQSECSIVNIFVGIYIQVIM